MIIWHIENENHSWEIDVGPITVLKGSNSHWYKVIRYIDDYFSNKNSTIEIFEDTHPIHKKDWECIFIPFDAHLQVEKITSKSPLRFLQSDVIDELALSPIFHELSALWEELSEEVTLMNQRIDEFELKVELSDLQIEDLKSYITFQAKSQMITPIEYKKLMVRLLSEKEVGKKRLVIIELPELFATENEIGELLLMINDLKNKGVRFIIVSERSDLKGNMNLYLDGNVINEAVIERAKNKVMSEVPFVCDEDLFERAANMLFQAVDNSSIFDKVNELKSNREEALIVVIFVLLKHLNIEINLDITGLKPNLDSFIQLYS